MPTQVDRVRSWLRNSRVPRQVGQRSELALRRQGDASSRRALKLVAAEAERQRSKEQAGAR